MCAPRSQPLRKEKKHGGVKTVRKQILLPQATAQNIKEIQNTLQTRKISIKLHPLYFLKQDGRVPKYLNKAFFSRNFHPTEKS